MKKILEVLLIISLIIGGIAPALGQNPNYDKMDKITREKTLAGASGIDVIIEFYQLDDNSIAIIPKEKILNNYMALNSIHAILTSEEIKNISSSLYVKNIWYNAPGLEAFGYMGADTIKASPLYTIGYKGNGVTVAVLDTGIRDTHVEFPQGKVLYQYDFVNNDPIADDISGHGTFVAGTISGQSYTTADWLGYVNYLDTTPTNTTGVAPDTKLVVLKTVPGDLSIFLNACNWLILNREKYNIRVVNMSAGWNVTNMQSNGWPLDGTDPASLAANSVVDKGIVWVNSAGNEGPNSDTIGAPGRAKNVITVANAIDRDVSPNGVLTIKKASLSIANDSSRGGGKSGLKPDISAPGTNILSATGASDNSYDFASGTSMAAPFVSGACAIILQRHPNWTPYQVKIAIMRTASQIPNASVYEQGAGMINVQKAFSYRQDFERASVIPRILAILKKNNQNN
ncbi:MAG: Pyrolysin precursor [Candidatus Methanofastidiosum methylothiophilum]|uniref:Pyrolysin n=1 Tax=Candidatus Methanofastidiosum methylothiophilum TaxID=1705564 RepID=A0A150J2Q8_9EURY|nr:MAG: Pyrolysin precursor [Candidatus Methanofastidiosum methylthiophilus]